MSFGVMRRARFLVVWFPSFIGVFGYICKEAGGDQLWFQLIVPKPSASKVKITARRRRSEGTTSMRARRAASFKARKLRKVLGRYSLIVSISRCKEVLQAIPDVVYFQQAFRCLHGLISLTIMQPHCRLLTNWNVSLVGRDKNGWQRERERENKSLVSSSRGMKCGEIRQLEKLQSLINTKQRSRQEKEVPVYAKDGSRGTHHGVFTLPPMVQTPCIQLAQE